MSARAAYTTAWVILALVFIGTLIALPSLPSLMATHWNASGQVDGTMSSLIGAFILPVVMLCVLLLFTAIPYIDPLRVNIQYFRRQYYTFVALLMLFFAVIQSSIISWNLGVQFDPMLIVLPAVGILLFYVGTILPKTRRNWFIGIRTPWTISSDHVWQKTHELGGRLFQAIGIIIILGVLAPSYALGIILIPIIVVALGLVVYSYFVYAQDAKRA